MDLPDQNLKERRKRKHEGHQSGSGGITKKEKLVSLITLNVARKDELVNVSVFN
jgi:hypothetical protein